MIITNKREIKKVLRKHYKTLRNTHTHTLMQNMPNFVIFVFSLFCALNSQKLFLKLLYTFLKNAKNKKTKMKLMLEKKRKKLLFTLCFQLLSKPSKEKNKKTKQKQNTQKKKTKKKKKMKL